MCGLFGYISKPDCDVVPSIEDGKFLEQVGMVSQLRGIDSSGYFVIDEDGEVHTDKEATHWTNFVSKGKTQYWIENRKMRVFIGHVRKATMGARGWAGAQPFSNDRQHMVHNGTLYNLLPCYPTASTDSEALLFEIQKNGMKEALQDQWGAFAILHFDEISRKLTISRNKERSLWCSWSPDKKQMYFASESWMLYEILFRVGIIKLLKGPDKHTVFSIPHGKLLEFDLSKDPHKGLKWEETVLDLPDDIVKPTKSWKPGPGWKPAVVTTPGYSYSPLPSDLDRILGQKVRLARFPIKQIRNFDTSNQVVYSGPMIGQDGKEYWVDASSYSPNYSMKIGDYLNATITKIKVDKQIEGVVVWPEKKDQDKEKPVKRKFIPSMRKDVFGNYVTDEQVEKWCDNGCVACGDPVQASWFDSYKILNEAVVCTDCADVYAEELAWINAAGGVGSGDKDGESDEENT